MRTRRLLATFVLTAVALTGCASVSSMDGSAVDGGGSVSEPAPGYDGVDTSGNTDNGSSVISTATAFLTADDPSTAAGTIIATTTSMGGRIDGRSVSTDPDGTTRWVSLTVRVPSASFESFLATLSDTATLESLSEYSQDVTLIVTDYEARITTLEASIARLQEMLTSANKTSDLIDIETALADRQAQLESLTAEMRYYADQIDMATIQIDIGLPDSAIDPAPDDFWSGVVAGWNGVVAFAGGVLIALGVVIPWLPVIAIVAAIAWVIVRRVRVSVVREETPAKPAPRRRSSTPTP